MRYFLVDSLKDWSNWVALDTTPPMHCQKPPFEAFYVFFPPSLLDYILGTTKVKRVDLNLKTKDKRAYTMDLPRTTQVHPTIQFLN